MREVALTHNVNCTENAVLLLTTIIINNLSLFERAGSRTMNVNKKLWSFIFGCVLAASCLWLIEYSKNAPLFESLSAYIELDLYQYIYAVNIVLAIAITCLTLIVMAKAFNICSSEHTFWLILPALLLASITVLYAKELLPAVLTVVLPSVIVASAIASLIRVKQGKTLS